ERLEDLSRMFLRLDYRPDLADAPVAPDPKRNPMRPQVLAAHEGFLAPNSVGLNDFSIFIRQERERELELGDKLVMGLHRVGADPNDAHPALLERGEGIAKRARLLRAAGSVILWIEVEDDVLPFEIVERQRAPAVGR